MKKKPSVAIQLATQSQRSSTSANVSASQQKPSVAIQHACQSQSSSSGANSAASQLAGASDPAITNLIAEIVNFGRFPKRHNAAQSKNDQEEDSFAQRLGRQKKSLSSDAWTELERIVASQLDAKHQELLAEVRNFGRFPKRINNPQTDDDRKANSFSKRLQALKKRCRKPFGRKCKTSVLLSLMNDVCAD